MNSIKLPIECASEDDDFVLSTRINRKANALLEDVTKRSGRSKGYIASRMIEFAYDFVEYIGEKKEG